MSAVADPPDISCVVRRARAGDQGAWQELVQTHQVVLRHVAREYRLSEADVADAVQTTWLRCLERLHQLRDPHCVTAWLVTTCRRECLILVRRSRREPPYDLTETGPYLSIPDRTDVGDVSEIVARDDDRDRLYAALDDLPAAQRRVVTTLLQHGDEGYAATAHRLGMPIGSLGPTRQRAFERLRRDRRLAVPA